MFEDIIIRKSFKNKDRWVVDVKNSLNFIHPDGSFKIEYVDYKTEEEAAKVLDLFISKQQPKPKCGDCEYYSGSYTCLKKRPNAYAEVLAHCPDFQPKQPNPKIRQFDSGATRDTDIGKLDYEGFLSPLVLQRYAQYLHKHRIQSDGQLRDSDNWQKGIPIVEYMKSKARHFINTWLIHRGVKVYDKGTLVDLEESLCAELFNTKGYLFEILKKKLEEKIEQ